MSMKIDGQRKLTDTLFYITDARLSKYFRSGKLTNVLLSQGLLTPKMLQQLQMEWSKTNKVN